MTTTMNNIMVAWNYEALLKIKEALNNDDSVKSYRVIRDNEWASEKFTVEISR